MDDVQRMREGIAQEYGIRMWAKYSEPEAAHFIGIDLKTLQKLRYAGKVPYVPPLGPRQIRYMGIHIIDLIGFGERWKEVNGNFPWERIPSPSEQAPTNTIASGTTPTPSAQTASAWAQETFKPRK